MVGTCDTGNFHFEDPLNKSLHLESDSLEKKILLYFFLTTAGTAILPSRSGSPPHCCRILAANSSDKQICCHWWFLCLCCISSNQLNKAWKHPSYFAVSFGTKERTSHWVFLWRKSAGNASYMTTNQQYPQNVLDQSEQRDNVGEVGRVRVVPNCRAHKLRSEGASRGRQALQDLESGYGVQYPHASSDRSGTTFE